MRFMMLMLPKGGYQGVPAGAVPDVKSIEDMTKYNSSLKKAGVLLAVDGLHPPVTGARVSFAGGRSTVSDGPFAESKEVVGGYWLISVKSREEALEWARRCPCGDGDTIEVRQVQEMADFPAEIQRVARI